VHSGFMRIVKRIPGLGVGSFLLLCYDIDGDNKLEILTEIRDGEIISIDPVTEVAKYNFVVHGKVLSGIVDDMDNDDKLEMVVCCCPNKVLCIDNGQVVFSCEVSGIPSTCFSFKTKNGKCLGVVTATFSIDFVCGNRLINHYQCLPPVALIKPLDIDDDGEDEILVLDATKSLHDLKMVEGELRKREYIRLDLTPIDAELIGIHGNMYLIAAAGNKVIMWNVETKTKEIEIDATFRVIKLISLDYDGDGLNEVAIISSSQQSTVIQVFDLEGLEELFTLEIDGFWMPIYSSDVNGDACEELILKERKTMIRITGLNIDEIFDLGSQIVACKTCDLDSDGLNEIIVRTVNEIVILKAT